MNINPGNVVNLKNEFLKFDVEALASLVAGEHSTPMQLSTGLPQETNPAACIIVRAMLPVDGALTLVREPIADALRGVAQLG